MMNNVSFEENVSSSHLDRRRSVWLSILLFMMLILSIDGFSRAQQAYFYRDLLAQLPVGVIYVSVSGIVFGLAGTFSVVAILLHWPFTPHLIRAVAVLYAIWYWIDSLLVARSDTALTNWPFMLVITILGLIFIFGLFTRPREKRYFHME